MKFYDEFHKLTEGKYRVMRLQNVEILPETMRAKVTFVVPYEILRDEFTQADFDAIAKAVSALMPEGYAADVQYSKCTPDEEIVRSFVLQYLKERQKALTGQYDEDKIFAQINDGKVRVQVPLSANAYEFCKNAGLDAKLKAYLDTRYCADNAVTLTLDETIDTGAIIQKEYEELYVDTGIVDIKQKGVLVGKSLEGSPRYIEKFVKPQTAICVCGRVAGFSRNIAKKNGRIYYSFILDDTTGEMPCMYFSRSAKRGALDCLNNDDCVAVVGDLVEDTFRNKGNKLMVRELALCEIDFDGIASRKELARKAIEEPKRKVFSHPEPYVDTTVKSLLDMTQTPCDFVTKNDFVVFDLETTGLDTFRDRIVEIGAVKIEKGEIVSYYDTFVDPKMPIPAGASNVNHIYDADVKDAPYIEDVIAEFLDYCKGCILVAHNASFDVTILERDARMNGLTLDNRVVDTLKLAQRLRPDLGRFNLGHLCRVYEIELINAHRAYFDAEATGRLLIKMANRAGLNENGDLR